MSAHPSAAAPEAPRTSPPPQDAPSPASILALACTGVFMIVLDATIVSVALPRIGSDLGFATGDLAWVVNAYTVAFAGLLLLAGRLVANHGIRTTFLAGIACFGTASLVCGLAPQPWVLVTARAIQGLGGAIVMPATLTMVTTTHTEPAHRARALGLWSAVGAAGAAAGTVAGGLLTDLAGWRWIFLVNVPITLGASLAATRLVPASPRGPDRARLDLLGAALATAGLVALVYGLLDTGTDGWSSPPVIGALAAAATLLALFLTHQRYWAAAPLVPLSMFRSRHLSAANAVIFLLGLGFFASPFLLALYLQDTLEYSPLRAGLAFLPAATALFIGAQTAGRLTHRFGVRPVATAGALGAAAGFGWLTQLGTHTAYWSGILGPQLLFGLGIGVAFTPITVAATAVQPTLAGVAAGVLNTVRQVAAAIGLAVLTTLAAPEPATNGGDYDKPFLVAACGALLAAAGAATLLPRRGVTPQPPNPR